MRDEVVSAAVPSAAGQAVSLPSPESKRGQERIDAAVLSSVMVSMCFGAVKFSYRTPPAAIPGFALTTVLSLLVSAWALLASPSYRRWREPTIAAVRLVMIAAPLTHFCVITAGAKLALITNGTMAPLLFLAALIFISQSFRLAIVGLGLPLSSPLHTAVQLLSLAIVWAQNEDSCSAVLQSCGSVGVGCAGGGGWFRQLTYARMPPPPEGLLGADTAAAAAALAGALNSTAAALSPSSPTAALSVAELTEGWYSAFSLLPMLLPHPLLMPLARAPAQQCGAMFGLFQVVLGFLLPVWVVLVKESREHCLEHGSREVPGGREGRTRGGQLMAYIYRAVWWAASGAGFSFVALGLAGMLATCWLGVTALV